MEQDRFDALAISLADEGTSRRSVLGRLAAGGVAAALGITAFTAFEDEDGEAKKLGKAKRKRVCVCANSSGASCKNVKVIKKKRKKILRRKPCSYAGRCKGVSGCPGGACTTNAQCAGGQQCINGQCASTCTGNAQCGSGQVCLNGSCTTACTSNGNCGGGQVCINGGCANICTSNGDCTGDQRCIDGVCGIPNTPPVGAVLCPTGTCAGGLLCVAGVCVAGCTEDDDCTGALVCGTLLGESVCVVPATPCGPLTPCTGTIISTCILGICVEI